MYKTTEIRTVTIKVNRPWRYEVKGNGVMPNIMELYRDYMGAHKKGDKANGTSKR